MPKVSVILPVFNGGKYISDSIRSILDQSFQDFEIIVIDDGSIDDTKDKISKFKDSKLIFFRFENNKGLIAALNFGLEKATGDYIARMDADDIACSNRLKNQVNFLEEKKDFVACGMAIERIPLKQHKYPPQLDQEIRAGLIFSNVFYHSTMMIRSKILKDYHLKYEYDFFLCEDYRLWTRLIQYGKMANLTKIGVKYRIHEQQITRKLDYDFNRRLQLVRNNYLVFFGVNLSYSELFLFNKFCEGGQLSKLDFFDLNLIMEKIYYEIPSAIKDEFSSVYIQFLFHYLSKNLVLCSRSYIYIYISTKTGKFSLMQFLKLIKRDVKTLIIN
ncbi:glycosyltransferase family 2 protein [Algoriphagus marincola]|uniref:glycosyltransferase family 2 protein n=1 Tax=Algoriphagus marincola TaxID=264027 RepID=UPI00042843C7|nr:glycosyltransferase family A protein [Algoriphagus marincola]